MLYTFNPLLSLRENENQVLVKSIKLFQSSSEFKKLKSLGAKMTLKLFFQSSSEFKEPVA